MGEEGKEGVEYFAEEGVGSGGRGKSNGLSLNVMLNESGDSASCDLLGTCRVVRSSSSELLPIGTMLACLLSIFVFPSEPALVIMVNAGLGALRACSSFSAIQKRGTASSSSPESSWMMCSGCLWIRIVGERRARVVACGRRWRLIEDMSSFR